jgi:hypothetical protein
MENEEIAKGKMGEHQNPESGEDKYPASSQNILGVGGNPGKIQSAALHQWLCEFPKRSSLVPLKSMKPLLPKLLSPPAQ